MQNFTRLLSKIVLASVLSLTATSSIAVEIKPTDPLASELGRAEGLIRKREGEQALAVLDEILKQDPQHRPTLYTKAKLLASMGRLDESQLIVDRLLKDEPPAALVQHLQGFIFSQRGEWQKALPYYQQAYPHGHDKYLMNTMTEAYLRVEGTDAAINFLSAHLEQYPDEQNVRLMRAKLFQRQQRLSAALEDYEVVKSSQPENPVVWKNMADLFILQRDKRAVPYAREAARLAPAVPEVNHTLGRALLESGQPAAALQVQRTAHQAKPGDASITYDYARALAANQQEDEARQVLSKLAESDSAIGTRARRLLEDMTQ